MDPILESCWHSQSAFLITNALRVFDKDIASSVFMVDLVGHEKFLVKFKINF